MIKGIGIDVTEISRIRDLNNKHTNFIKKILTPAEIAELKDFSNKRKIEYLAGRFSIKESFSKALKTGIGKDFSFQDLSVLNKESGVPYISQAPIDDLVHISISHTDKLVFTEVIIEEK